LRQKEKANEQDWLTTIFSLGEETSIYKSFKIFHEDIHHIKARTLWQDMGVLCLSCV